MYEKNIKDKKDKNYDKRDEKKSFVFVNDFFCCIVGTNKKNYAIDN